MSTEDPLVFLSYYHKDVLEARRLYASLKRYGANLWMDKVELLPGEIWDEVIGLKIRECRYFLALLSSESLSHRGYVQYEVRQALNVLQQVPSGSIYLIPARLDECVPRDPELQRINWVDLFPSWDMGIEKILRALGIPVEELSDLELHIRAHIDVSRFQKNSMLPDYVSIVAWYPDVDDTNYLLWNDRERRLYKVIHSGVQWYSRYKLDAEDEEG